VLAPSYSPIEAGAGWYGCVLAGVDGDGMEVAEGMGVEVERETDAGTETEISMRVSGGDGDGEEHGRRREGVYMLLRRATLTLSHPSTPSTLLRSPSHLPHLGQPHNLPLFLAMTHDALAVVSL
jgi:hypothetical protein